ncbi:hypothetical protein AB1K62_14505 [Parasphingorhabdus sp. JC815]|uniref:hypothetical protein n=1 Tax=Parasphingorhabdus sp. JC815 TaxID=3232140 RepID=UPI00345A403D
MQRTQEHFETEIAEARRLLESHGRIIGDVDFGPSEESSLKSDYELPYSSMPKLRGKKWIKSEKYA